MRLCLLGFRSSGGSKRFSYFFYQRCDSEKDKHKVVVTSDARKHLLMVRKTEKAALEKKQAEESERLRKMSEVSSH